MNDLRATLHGMKHNDVREFHLSRGGGQPTKVRVGYHAEQSYGDNGKPVRGAKIGYYHVHHEGRTRLFEHGPHAETEQAARRGANPNAKSMTAEHVYSHILGLA